jgi:glutamyl-tRNA reductase
LSVAERSGADRSGAKLSEDGWPRVAFLGLGALGAPMAANLLAAGFPLTVHNRTPARQ